MAGCDERLREHLRAVPTMQDHPSLLAEILAEDLAHWPSDAWLVLDEYQELLGAEAAEHFLSDLVGACPIQLLITSRQRPSWVTARSILYGHVLELNQFVLAMDSREAAEVLGEINAQSASGLVALANGWPAVIGLASVSFAEVEGEQVPESLYRFFAEEVFEALGGEIREGIATLGCAPVLDRELAAALLGDARFERVCTAALDVGLLEEREALIELHPLARSFLEEFPKRAKASADLIRCCLEHYLTRHDWDAAFELIVRRGLSGELEPLIDAALDELLSMARLSTVEEWCTVAERWGMHGASFSLARAEIALRIGRHAEAQAFAEVAAVNSEDNPKTAFRALCAAGRAAHLASREEDALDLYRRAAALAADEAQLRDALWGQLTCAIELERADAGEMLAELSAGARMSDPRDYMRAAGCRTIYQLKMAELDLGEAEIAHDLMPTVSDPLVKAAFQSVYAHALALVARYQEALEIAESLLSVARKYRFDFAVPYACNSAAIAQAGLRRWIESERWLDEAHAAARKGHDLFAEQACFAVRMRVFAQQAKPAQALSLLLPDLSTALPSMRAEVLSSRALVLACAGRLDDALALIQEVRDTSRAVEAAVLIPAVDAVVALKRGESDVIDHVARLEESAFLVGALDILTTAYRSTPELLHVLFRRTQRPERLGEAMRRIGDEDLAVAAQVLIGAADRASRLTARERDVYMLIREGLSNRQIAGLLFLSESTVKLHAHRIYDKLGVRSRTALVIQAALERSDQATSATAGAEVEPS